MDNHALEVLEYGELLKILSEYASTPAGKKQIVSLMPSVTKRKTQPFRALSCELRLLAEEDESWEQPVFDVPEEILATANRVGSVLAPEELFSVGKLLSVAEKLETYLKREACLGASELQAASAELDSCKWLRERFLRTFDERGGVLDKASSELASLRSGMRRTEHSINRHLETMLKASELEGVAQESFVTVRNARFVIPIKRQMKGRLRGVIHDLSDSGKTVFVEPDTTLPLGNELADLRLQERAEIRRILAALTDSVRAIVPQIRINIRILTCIDVAAAIARWARKYDCEFPRQGSQLQLFKARHPLLDHRFRDTGKGDSLIPLELRLSPEIGVLAITGSNSGGKTVALKTVGLLCLCAHAGLPIPAGEDSTIPLFSDVLADIGDEQSLVENLSTFTGRMTHITDILKKERDGRMLVLLDELGSGTDPLEGGALACSILTRLSEMNALSVVTTHLGVVKTFVHETSGMLNAAMRFNLQSLEPEYVLEVGRPGASHALTIARRIGMPDDVLQRASEMLNSDHLKLESMLEQLEEDQRLASRKEEEAHRTLQDLARNRESLKSELDTLRKERKKLMHDAYRQASGIVENTRSKMEKLLAGIRRSEKEEAAEDTRQLRKSIEEQETNINKAIRQTQSKPSRPMNPSELKEGQTVWVEKINGNAVILTLSRDRKKAEVEHGGIRFSIKTSEIGIRDNNAPAPRPETSVKVSVPRSKSRVKSEINLIGRRVDEAVDELELYIDQCLLSGKQEVRIIHGFGSGRLQQGVHDYLKHHARIRTFRLGEQGKDPGGGGATIVEF